MFQSEGEGEVLQQPLGHEYVKTQAHRTNRVRKTADSSENMFLLIMSIEKMKIIRQNYVISTFEWSVINLLWVTFKTQFENNAFKMFI